MTPTPSTTPARPHDPWAIRPFAAAQDAADLRRLDTSIETDRAYAIQRRPDGVLLVEATLPGAIAKRFDIDLAAVPVQHGWVALRAGQVQGFVGVSVEAWNSRLAIWHFYVARAHRGLGAGRLLMTQALAWGRERGARSAWIETSNLNVPGIRAYAALGFEVCGFDTSIYRHTAARAEFALFMSRDA